MDCSQHEPGRSARGRRIQVCEAAIKDQLIGDYDPVTTVTFKESMPAGDLSYTAYSDDGDGQWSCTVSGSGAGMEATVFDGN